MISGLCTDVILGRVNCWYFIRSWCPWWYRTGCTTRVLEKSTHFGMQRHEFYRGFLLLPSCCMFRYAILIRFPFSFQIGQESADLNREIQLLERQSTLISNSSASINEVLQLYEKYSMDAMFQGA